jgi:hypothetical protein
LRKAINTKNKTVTRIEITKPPKKDSNRP